MHKDMQNHLDSNEGEDMDLKELDLNSIEVACNNKTLIVFLRNK
jgi:hypothetical protein